MPYNIVEQNRASTQSGLALGRAMFDNALRAQQLKSQQELRQLEMRQRAEEIALLTEKRQLAIQERADFAKAGAAIEAESMLTMPQFGPPQAGQGEALPDVQVQQAPSAQTILKHTLGPMLKWRPQEADNYVANLALYEQRQRLAQHGFVPQVGQVTLPSGAKVDYAAEGPNNVRYFPPDQVAPRQKAAYTRAEHAKMVNWVRDKRPDLMPQLVRDADGVLTVPDKLIPEVAKQAGLTTATRTALEQVELGADNVFALGRELLPLINERTTGAKAEAKRLLQRTGITAIFPALDDPEISEAEAVGRTFAAGVVRAMRSDSNIGIREQETLARAAETINWTTAKSGKTKLAAVVRQAADHSRRAAMRKGTPINPLFLTRDEIRARVVAGDITPEEGKQLYDNSAESFLRTIEEQLK